MIVGIFESIMPRYLTTFIPRFRHCSLSSLLGKVHEYIYPLTIPRNYHY